MLPHHHVMEFQKNIQLKRMKKLTVNIHTQNQKNSCEDIIIHWSKVYRFKFISLRLFNVYGTLDLEQISAYGAALWSFSKTKIKQSTFYNCWNRESKKWTLFMSQMFVKLFISHQY